MDMGNRFRLFLPVFPAMGAGNFLIGAHLIICRRHRTGYLMSMYAYSFGMSDGYFNFCLECSWERLYGIACIDSRCKVCGA